MSSLQEKAAEAAAKMQQSNPSAASGAKPLAERKRVPMSLPKLKLEVPEIPGYHLYWFRGTAQRIAQAQAAWYEFVAPEEIDVSSVSIGGDAAKSGNTDLGDRVSVVAGDIGDDGQAVRLYLMKQKMEYYLEDQKLAQARNDSVADALTQNYRTGLVGGPAQGEQKADVDARYVRQAQSKVPEMFKKKAAK